MTHWTASRIPPQHGRVAVVTGTGGLGLQTALELARAGARVIVAGRNPLKGEAAVAAIRRDTPDADARFEELDLARLDSVRAFAERLRGSERGVDVLINNAAIMMPPSRRLTDDGFELQFGTNHLGHFALTARLLPLLRAGRGARVVSLSSLAARAGRLRVDDLQCARLYQPMDAYGQSKLACLMFALELQRRSDAAGWGVQGLAAHPGIARTELLPNGAGPTSPQALARRFLWFLFQPVAQGALPTLFAATAPEAQGGGYYGPDCLAETRGHPTIARMPPQALDSAAAAWLWDESARLTGVEF